MKLVSLTGILELLLTHNPDAQRFNIEDSITKQFKLKMAVIIYQQDNKCDFAEVKKNLNMIYNLRSKIAHGDFGELNLSIAKEFPSIKISKNTKFEDLTDEEKKLIHQQKDSVLTKYNEILFRYVFYAISAFLDDPEFVEFLKAG